MKHVCIDTAYCVAALRLPTILQSVITRCVCGGCGGGRNSLTKFLESHSLKSQISTFQESICFEREERQGMCVEEMLSFVQVLTKKHLRSQCCNGILASTSH